jgi:hypothetical protein
MLRSEGPKIILNVFNLITSDISERPVNWIASETDEDSFTYYLSDNVSAINFTGE